MRDKIERYGLTRTIDPDHFFPTVDAAVAAYRAETDAQWTTHATSTAGLLPAEPSTAMTGPDDE